MVRHDDIADDLTQETYWKAVRNLTDKGALGTDWNGLRQDMAVRHREELRSDAYQA
jgi:hypothetical protein